MFPRITFKSFCETLESQELSHQPQAFQSVSVGIPLSFSPPTSLLSEFQWNEGCLCDSKMKILLSGFVTDDISHMFAVNHVHSETNKTKQKTLEVINIKTVVNHLQWEYRKKKKKKLCVTWRRHDKTVRWALYDRTISYADTVPVSSFDSTLHISSGLHDVHTRAVQG